MVRIFEDASIFRKLYESFPSHKFDNFAYCRTVKEKMILLSTDKILIIQYREILEMSDSWGRCRINVLLIFVLWW